MLDTQTGRLWKYQVDDKSKMLVLAPIVYAVSDGTLSLVPVDANTELEAVRTLQRATDASKSQGKDGTGIQDPG